MADLNFNNAPNTTTGLLPEWDDKVGHDINKNNWPGSVDKAQLDKLGASINPTGSVGMKYDGGKLQAGILFEDFANALTGVSEIATFGANKYARSSWITVPDAARRYKDALVRHQLAIGRGELYDDESNLLHAAHFAWNALATLELLLRSGVTINRGVSGNIKYTRGIELVEADRPD